jgi:pimeloyl-ACP methyl ester carboxylesterase
MLCALIAACDSAPSTTDTLPSPELASLSRPLSVNVTREHVTGDVYHYEFTVRVGTTANAELHIHRVVRERAPFFPRPTTRVVLELPGDFATFVTNFAPVLGTPASSENGMATWLAQRGIDVWGLDRRSSNAPLGEADVNDFAEMGIDQANGDIATALAFARGIRLVTDASFEKVTLIGFSRGGQLAYLYASFEANRPVWQRHLKGLVPLDVSAVLSPDDVDERQMYCDNAAFALESLAEGFVDSPNDFQIDMGALNLSAPDDPSPWAIFFPQNVFTNHETFLAFAGQTYVFFHPNPLYHLAAPVLDGDVAIGLRESSEEVIATWFAGAPGHSSMREAGETDQLQCGDAPVPVDLPLSRIRVPLLLIAAKGGYGTHALFTTTQVSSTDVTTLVISRLPDDREAEDFGHGDILFARDAAALAWQPLLSWLRSH